MSARFGATLSNIHWNSSNYSMTTWFFNLRHSLSYQISYNMKKLYQRNIWVKYGARLQVWRENMKRKFGTWIFIYMAHIYVHICTHYHTLVHVEHTTEPTEPQYRFEIWVSGNHSAVPLEGCITTYHVHTQCHLVLLTVQIFSTYLTRDQRMQCQTWVKKSAQLISI